MFRSAGCQPAFLSPRLQNRIQAQPVERRVRGGAGLSKTWPTFLGATRSIFSAFQRPRKRPRTAQNQRISITGREFLPARTAPHTVLSPDAQKQHPRIAVASSYLSSISNQTIRRPTHETHPHHRPSSKQRARAIQHFIFIRIPDAPQALPKTVAVAAFKNGLAFVVRQGVIHLQSGVGRITPIPNATLGTLWLAPGESGASLDEVVAYHYNVAAQQNMQSLAEVLQANAGKTVTINYNNKDYTGEIVGLHEPDASSINAAPSPNPEPPTNPTPIATTQYLLLRVDKKLVALPVGGIVDAVFPDDTVFTQKIDQQRSALRFKVKGAAGKTNLTVGYLEHGLGWTPSYLISLTDEKTAQITMQAVVIDDAENLNDADVFFVVGVPNFAYSNIPSPMSLQQNLMAFMKDAEQPTNGRNYLNLNSIAAQVLALDDEKSETGAEPTFAQSVSELSGAPEEDLFLYTRAGVTLARDERATYNVFSTSVAYEHIYEWEVQDQPRVDGFGNVINPNPNPTTSDAAANSIWHSIRPKNNSKFPWTSAPALVISGTKPVSQDTLPYTPKAAILQFENHHSHRHPLQPRGTRSSPRPKYPTPPQLPIRSSNGRRHSEGKKLQIKRSPPQHPQKHPRRSNRPIRRRQIHQTGRSHPNR